MWIKQLWCSPDRIPTILIVGFMCVGSVFAQQETVLYSFTGGSDGYEPQGTLVADAAGNLYGTTTWGGGQITCSSDPGCGTVFELTPVAGGEWTETVLYRFQGGSDGGEPTTGPLVIDAAGNLYGTTTRGGTVNAACPQGCGTAFELAPPARPGGSWIETVLHSFQSGPSDGAVPSGGLVLDRLGNLYGNTMGGEDYGTVYELSPPSMQGGAWIEKVLYTFKYSPDGAVPVGNLLFDPSGNLYGTTLIGGSGNCQQGGCGTVFQLHHSPDGSWKETILHSFTGPDGSNPRAGVTLSKGALYGTTSLGGSGNGTIFQLADVNGLPQENVVYNFKGLADASPYFGVVADSSGNLYGVAGGAEVSAGGEVYRLTPPAVQGGPWTEKVLHVFKGGVNLPNGFDPYGLMLLNGSLYGSTALGGDLKCVDDPRKGCGVVFSITP